MQFLNHIFKRYRPITIILLAIFSLTVFIKVFAAGGPTYDPGETLNPAEGPDTAVVSIFPDQSGHDGEFLQTDGSATSWQTTGGGDESTFESGTFTLSADGTTATVTMNGFIVDPQLSATRIFTIALTNIAGTFNVGDTVGETYLIITNVDLIESNLSFSAPNDGIDYSTYYTPRIGDDQTEALANASLVSIKFILTIPTTSQLKLWEGFIYPVDINDFSRGISDGTIQNTNGSSNSSINNDAVNCISIFDRGFNGWTGLITRIADTEFDITFTQIGSGLDITGEMHLTEE